MIGRGESKEKEGSVPWNDYKLSGKGENGLDHNVIDQKHVGPRFDAYLGLR